LFILRNPNSLRGKTREEFIDYCLNPNTQHYLVIVYEEFGLKNKFLITLGTNHGVISVSTPFENEMVKWVKKFFEQNGVRNISGKLTKKIIEAYGDSLFSLKNEIDKLSLNFSGDSVFTDDELDNFISSTRGYKKFELFNYLGKKETFLSLKLGRSLVSQDSSMLELLKPLNEFYQELLFAKIFSGTNQAKKSFSLLAPSILRQLPMYANNYSGKEIVSALKRLGKIDKQIKSSQIDDESAITEFIFSATSDG
jgi:DNA polymerase III delta subunit